MVISPYISLSERFLHVIPHLIFFNKVFSVFLDLTIDGKQIEVARIEQQTVLAVIFRTHLTMNFALLVVNDGARPGFFHNFFAL